MSYDGTNGTEMDTSDSRKRPLDGETDNGVTKRSNQGGVLHYGNTSSSTWQTNSEVMQVTSEGDASVSDTGRDNIHLKILVPSVAAGAIIGKGGETIAQIQKEAGARVKMSKANDFYPGTTERICLIMGAPDAVRQVNNFIMEKIREKPESNPTTPTKPDDAKNNFERHRQVKILIPNSTAGMIIGKGGNYIKQIKEESGAYVQISQKSKETNLPERCVTVAGELDANMKAMDLILQKIVEDPQSSSCPNISYADYTGPVASANPTGSPFANTPYQTRTTEMMNNTTAAYPTQGFNFGSNGNNSYNGMGLAGLNMTLSAAAMGLGGPMAAQALENLKMTLRSSGYTEQATDEISTAMNTLANYGILGMGIGGVNQMGANMTASSLANMQGMQMAGTSGGNTSFGATTSQASSMFGPVGSTTTGQQQSTSLFGSSSPSMAGAPDRYGSSPMLDTFTQTPGYAASASAVAYPPQDRSTGTVTVNVNQNSFGLGTGMYSPTDDKTSTKQEMEVPENIVGAILGPGGKGIVEIQQYTGTNIQISKKGVYAPGTHNRIVCISGTVSNITRAQYMIQQRIQQEEYKRARQATAR
ncbi:RNA-binding protein Nova-2-like isoform X2 [Biomphalaria glabrata]|uniref:RNA-binding protein Pasilla-like isoform X2 n=1 Tax=Biomphalaria glabrata TaxID=6526 RepID=A0A9U8E2A7_BIOGL|nr:RNA-binding protein Pasilla-like isoform X2 [Biomphalaria glabrata]KAI8741192.1 RNA-binding protein Nova-2-like isoform X2 [Biomphalaria glabrata]